MNGKDDKKSLEVTKINGTDAAFFEKDNPWEDNL
jgi:hypothetical protein